MNHSTNADSDAPFSRESNASAFVPGPMLGRRYRIVASVGRAPLSNGKTIGVPISNSK